jgi:hypothetical protein
MKKYTVKNPFQVSQNLIIKDDILYAEDKGEKYVDVYHPKTRKKIGYIKKESFLEKVKESLT